MSSPVTILLVPGAFGTADGFAPIVPLLKEAGFSTQAASFPSSNSKEPTTLTCADDSKYVREQILQPGIERDSRYFIILAHSYGGIVAAGAATGLDAVARHSRGLTGGVLGLVYIAGNIALENESLLQAVGGAYPPFIIRDEPTTGLAIMNPVMETLYGDCNLSMKSELESAMVPHAYNVFETEAPMPCWLDAGFKNRLVYIRTSLDACNPAFLQDLWMEKSGVEWEVVNLESSHAPFISQPKAVVGAVVAAAKKFSG